MVCIFLFFFFKQKTAYEMRISDWSSDVCSSDLSSRTNDRCATVGASMRRPVSLRGKRLMADKKSDVVLPEWTPQDAYNSHLPRPPRPPGAHRPQPRRPARAHRRPRLRRCRCATLALPKATASRPLRASRTHVTRDTSTLFPLSTGPQRLEDQRWA